MKLYGEANPAPNPRRVRIFAAEKGLDLPEIRIGMRQGGHKSPEHKARNSLGQVPVLELDDGEMISESVAICRYLDILQFNLGDPLSVQASKAPDHHASRRRRHQEQTDAKPFTLCSRGACGNNQPIG